MFVRTYLPLSRPYPSVPKLSLATALADVDPLGVNQSVTFDEVGGLDDRTCIVLYLYPKNKEYSTSPKT